MVPPARRGRAGYEPRSERNNTFVPLQVHKGGERVGESRSTLGVWIETMSSHRMIWLLLNAHGGSGSPTLLGPAGYELRPRQNSILYLVPVPLRPARGHGRVKELLLIFATNNLAVAEGGEIGLLVKIIVKCCFVDAQPCRVVVDAHHRHRSMSKQTAVRDVHRSTPHRNYAFSPVNFVGHILNPHLHDQFYHRPTEKTEKMSSTVPTKGTRLFYFWYWVGAFNACLPTNIYRLSQTFPAI